MGVDCGISCNLLDFFIGVPHAIIISSKIFACLQAIPCVSIGPGIRLRQSCKVGPAMLIHERSEGRRRQDLDRITPCIEVPTHFQVA